MQRSFRTHGMKRLRSSSYQKPLISSHTPLRLHQSKKDMTPMRLNKSFKRFWGQRWRPIREKLRLRKQKSVKKELRLIIKIRLILMSFIQILIK
jgi:hypothetical protein